MTIRPARPNDLATLVEIERAAGETFLDHARQASAALPRLKSRRSAGAEKSERSRA